MNKKGFTLVEVLVTIVIISLVSGIGVISYQTFFKTGEERYYNALESNLLLAGSDYFTDHRDQLPTGNEVNYVSLSKLIDNKYIEPVKDSDGNICTEGKVYAYRENNKFKYETCIINCGGYSSKGKYCDETAPSNVINISAIVLGSNPTRTYDVSKTYNSVEYLKNNEVVRVTFSMSNTKAVYYEVINTTTTTNTLHCSRGTGTSCYVDVNKSGTYKVTAYDSANPSTRKVVATNQYFSVRITTQGPQFTITGASKTLMSKTESACNGNVNAKPTKSVTYTIVKSNINEEYKKVEYKITGNQYNVNNGNYKENTNANKLVITESLPSGKYTLDVKITNFAGEESVETKTFDISFYIDTKFSDNDYAGLDNKHEVVAGQKYDYIKTLPTYKVAYTKNMEIRWHLSTEEFDESRRIFGSSIVPRSCTYEINGLMAIPVKVPNWTEYCLNPTYDGTSKALTKKYDHVTFLNKGTDNLAYQTDAGIYDVEAKIDSPYYIWEGLWNFDNLSLKCEIKRAAVNFPSCSSKEYNGSSQTLFVAHTSGVGYTNSAITGTNAGSYKGDLTPDANHQWTDTAGTEERSLSCSITRANVNFPSCSSKEYNGSSQTLFVAHTSGVGYTNSAITGTNAGSYKGDLTPDANHQWTDTAGTEERSLSCYISKVQATLKCTNRTYNGSSQYLYSNATGCSSVTNGTQTNAGGPWTLTCNPDGNHTSPSTCTASMEQADPGAQCTNADHSWSGSWVNIATSSHCKFEGADATAQRYVSTSAGGYHADAQVMTCSNPGCGYALNCLADNDNYKSVSLRCPLY